MRDAFNRRAFLGKMGACAVGGALSHLTTPARAASAAKWTAPPKLTNPNILIIIVDQMRWPQWLSPQQLSILNGQLLPNIAGRIKNNAYVFEQYYTAATVCTAARGTLLTGLYAPQTGVYVDGPDGLISTSTPALETAFPTWAWGIQGLNPAYSQNCWWFGKWHLSDCKTTNPLTGYGFNTRTYPGGAAGNPSPNGVPNEGTDGGQFGKQVYASDALIAGDFVGWINGQSPTSGPPSSPWCCTVSLINPHDITDAPAWLQSKPFPPRGVPKLPVYFPPPAFPPSPGAPAIYTGEPSPWNYEDLTQVTNKPSVQYAFQTGTNKEDGDVTDWVTFLNMYYWLQNYVDSQVGAVLDAIDREPYNKNTVVIFLADHGEYGGSHGLHDKGSAIYDEVIRAPLYVRFPGQTGSTEMNQMCSSVDFFGLACDLATSGGGAWQAAYPDLANRQSLWNFLYGNANETRIAPNLGVPYILHTCDENSATPNAALYHVVGLRTKTDPNNSAQPGAKLGIYSAWGECTVIPDGTKPDYEFYDYNPATTQNPNESGNTMELGNDYYSDNPATQAAITAYLNELGNWGPPQTGLIASELNAPLEGKGTDGKPLTKAQDAARQHYYNYIYGKGICPV